MNRKQIERLHEINILRDKKIITAKEYTTLRKELTAQSQSKKARAIGWAEVICVLSPILAILYILVTHKSGKKKFSVLALSLILNMWVQVCNVARFYEANTSNVLTNEQVLHKKK